MKALELVKDWIPDRVGENYVGLDYRGRPVVLLKSLVNPVLRRDNLEEGKTTSQ
jgi:hypothetical protein